MAYGLPYIDYLTLAPAILFSVLSLSQALSDLCRRRSLVSQLSLKQSLLGSHGFWITNARESDWNNS